MEYHFQTINRVKMELPAYMQGIIGRFIRL